MRYNKRIVVSALCIGMSFLLTACGTTAKPQNAVNVHVVQASLDSITTNVEYASKLIPIQEITISPKVSGKVATVQADVGSDQSIQSAEAQVKQAESSVNYATVQVQNTIITSPIDGTVSTRNVEVGEITSNATPAFTVIDTKTIVAEINVPDKMAVQLKKGQTVSVKISALKDKLYTGTINVISPAADSKTNSYVIDVDIDNPTNELKSGMFARVILPAEQKDNVLAIPNEAITMEEGSAYVYTVNKNTVNKVLVQIGISNDKVTEIVSGLKSGDNLITEGQIFLSEGEKVNILKS